MLQCIKPRVHCLNSYEEPNINKRLINADIFSVRIRNEQRASKVWTRIISR
jgi:hypothetical protein